ncbi:MAG: ferredoxin [Syntrophaceae bacterium]
MKVRIDEELCTGCGLCEETAPEVFELVDDKAVVKGTEIKEDLIEKVKEAADDCPAEAIIIEG